jgi:hypothetical protein
MLIMGISNRFKDGFPYAVLNLKQRQARQTMPLNLPQQRKKMRRQGGDDEAMSASNT